MRVLLISCVLLALGGCASLQPTAVNPALTCVNNTTMALVAAAGGDCTVPICAPSVGAGCANLPVTATVDQNKAAFEGCIVAAGGTRLSVQANAAKAALCARTSPQPLLGAPQPMVRP